MALHNVTQAAKLTGKARRTIQRYLKAGKLSAANDRAGNPQIETAELIRVFGALSHPGTPENVTADHTPLSHPQALEEIRQELKAARQEIQELRALVLRLEHKPDPAQVKPGPQVIQETPKAPKAAPLSSLAELARKYR